MVAMLLFAPLAVSQQCRQVTVCNKETLNLMKGNMSDVGSLVRPMSGVQSQVYLEVEIQKEKLVKTKSQGSPVFWAHFKVH